MPGCDGDNLGQQRPGCPDSGDTFDEDRTEGETRGVGNVCTVDLARDRKGPLPRRSADQKPSAPSNGVVRSGSWWRSRGCWQT